MPVICLQRKATERATKSALEQRSMQCKERLDGASCFHSMDNGLWSFEVEHFSHSCFSKAHLIKEPGMGAVDTPGRGANGDPGGSDAWWERLASGSNIPPRTPNACCFLNALVRGLALWMALVQKSTPSNFWWGLTPESHQCQKGVKLRAKKSASPGRTGKCTQLRLMLLIRSDRHNVPLWVFFWTAPGYSVWPQACCFWYLEAICSRTSLIPKASFIFSSMMC